PFVVARGGRFYLFIGPDWEGLLRSKRETGRYDWKYYRGTRVLASDDPFHFTLAGQVGFLDAHAAEVVEDESGATWVSHCGWNQGGLYLAPLAWDQSSEPRSMIAATLKEITRPVTSTIVVPDGAEALAGSKRGRESSNGSIGPTSEPDSTIRSRLVATVGAISSASEATVSGPGHSH